MLLRRPRCADRAGTLVLMLLAWGLLVFRLDEVPPGFQHDQTFSSLDAMQVLGGHYPIYFPDNFGRGPLFMYSVAGIFRLTGGHWVWSLHFTAVVWGMLALATTILLARRYVPRGAALFVASLMVGSFWFLLAARLGVESISLLPLATAMAYCLGRGLTQHSWPQLMLGGILGGIANYTYLASRMLYLLAPLLLAYLLLSALWEKVERKDLLGLSLSFGLTIGISSPLLIYLLSHPAANVDRQDRTTQWRSESGHERRHRPAPGQFVGHCACDPLERILCSTLPIQRAGPTGTAASLGTVLDRRLDSDPGASRERHNFVLLVSLWLGLLPSLLTGADALYMRSICALPLLFILVGRGRGPYRRALRPFRARFTLSQGLFIQQILPAEHGCLLRFAGRAAGLAPH